VTKTVTPLKFLRKPAGEEDLHWWRALATQEESKRKSKSEQRRGVTWISG